MESTWLRGLGSEAVHVPLLRKGDLQMCLVLADSTYKHFGTLYSGSKEQKLEMLEILTDKGFSGYVDK